AICGWEGWNDPYRDGNRHGGIICTFRKHWQDMQVKTVQHGQGERGARNRVTGELVCGPETLSEDELARNREDMWGELLSREMDGPYYRERSADLAKVAVPLLSAANWGGQGLHTRGNFEGFVRSSSRDKWLEVHGGSHWAPFYTDYGRKLQLDFFDHFLKGRQNGWDRKPRVLLNVRHPGERFVPRHENEWPLARTKWTRFYLDPTTFGLVKESVSSEKAISYDTMGEGVTFSTPPLRGETEIWPTCIVVPAGYRVALTLRGKDYEYAGEAATLSNMKNPMKGCGPFVHDDPADRPPQVFGGKVTLHFDRKPFVLLPIIPGN